MTRRTSQLHRINERLDAEIKADPFAYALANELALASVNRVLASIDRLDALDAQIAADLADYRSIGAGRGLG